jgi:hypothetical protein
MFREEIKRAKRSLRRWRRDVPPKRRFIINPYGATTQKEAL